MADRPAIGRLRLQLWLTLLLATALFAGSLFLPNLPRHILEGHQAEQAIAALDAVRPPLLRLERVAATLGDGDSTPAAGATLNHAVQEADRAVERYLDAMAFDPEADARARHFRDVYRDWKADLLHIRDHLGGHAGANTPPGHLENHVAVLSTGFVDLLEALALGEAPLHGLMARGRRASVLATGLGVGYLVTVLLAVAWHQRRVTRLVRMQQQHLEVTLNSIGDAVIATDIHGRVERMNPIAEHLTGWDTDQARGRFLTEVFRIVNAQSGRPADNPVTRVLEKGEIVGLANDTLLISRDGSRYQIHDSAAPIREPDGRIRGVILVFRDISEEYRLRTESREHARRLEAVITHAPDAILLADEQGTILEWNPAAEQIFGWARKQAMGRRVHELIIPQRWIPEHLAGMQRFLAHGEESHLIRTDRFTALRRDGSEFPIELTVIPIHRSTGWLFAAFIRDLTEARKAQEELRLAATTFQTHAGILVTDAEGTILRVNPAYEAMTGYSAEELVGRNPRILQSGRQDRAFYERMWRELKEKGQWQGELWNRRKDGSLYAQLLTITAVRDEQGRITHYIGTSQDITALKEAEAEVEYRAYHDELTGLPNRRWLHDRLTRELAAARQQGSQGALLYLDLERFTQINDTAGHTVGDLILRETAERLQALLKEDQGLARVASDEFAIVLPPTDADPSRVGVRAQNLAERIQSALQQPFRIGEQDYHLGASVGIALFPQDQTSPEEIMDHADNALHRAKEEAPGSIRFFQPGMQAGIRNRLRIEEALRRALERDDELVLHYQPQVDEQGLVLGCEALLRWEHPEQGTIPPLQFIPIAEESGLINDLGRWVLGAACRQIRRWLDAGMEEARATVAINVSPRQFAQPDFIDQIREGLVASGIPARLLEIEITEGLLMHDVDEAIGRLAALRDMDIRIAIDDFGTGYSSMNYLKRLPADRLKIDRSFVRDIHADPGDARIVETIIGMAHHLGLGVVAEGVETVEHVRFLTERDCDFMQGYYFSRPVPADEYRRLAEIGRLPEGASGS